MLFEFFGHISDSLYHRVVHLHSLNCIVIRSRYSLIFLNPWDKDWRKIRCDTLLANELGNSISCRGFRSEFCQWRWGRRTCRWKQHEWRQEDENPRRWKFEHRSGNQCIPNCSQCTKDYNWKVIQYGLYKTHPHSPHLSQVVPFGTPPLDDVPQACASPGG